MTEVRQMIRGMEIKNQGELGRCPGKKDRGNARKTGGRASARYA